VWRLKDREGSFSKPASHFCAAGDYGCAMVEAEPGIGRLNGFELELIWLQHGKKKRFRNLRPVQHFDQYEIVRQRLI
jgi:hypothetical protein